MIQPDLSLRPELIHIAVIANDRLSIATTGPAWSLGRANKATGGKLTYGDNELAR